MKFIDYNWYRRRKMNTALLTIDDFSSGNTPAIVDYLKEKGIKIIFFATGKNVEEYYEEAIYAVKSGMIVGNHRRRRNVLQRLKNASRFLISFIKTVAWSVSTDPSVSLMVIKVAKIRILSRNT